MTEQQKAFEEVLDVFNEKKLIPYIMIIGTWAEYLYQECIYNNFTANLKTRDVDILYTNIRKPNVTASIGIKSALAEKGFMYKEDVVTNVGKLVKEDLLEIEFITRSLRYKSEIYHIPALGINAVGLLDAKILAKYPTKVNYMGKTVVVPEPEAYVLQKLLINSTRKIDKQEKDIASVENLAHYINKNRLFELRKNLTNKEKVKVEATIAKYALEKLLEAYD